jgi:hypothetical protein
VALQSLKDLGRLTYRRFLELFRLMVGLLGRVISPSQGLYLHRTTQRRKMRTNIHALSGIRTHDPSNQPAKTHVSDRTATVIGIFQKYKYLICIISADVSRHGSTSFFRRIEPENFRVRFTSVRPSYCDGLNLHCIGKSGEIKHCDLLMLTAQFYLEELSKTTRNIRSE